jgi:hypothetical protein
MWSMYPCQGKKIGARGELKVAIVPPIVLCTVPWYDVPSARPSSPVVRNRPSEV